METCEIEKWISWGENYNLLCSTVFYEKPSADITVIKSSKDVFILRGMEALAGLVPLTPANIPPSNPY